MSPAEAHPNCIERDWGAACVSTDHHGVAVGDWECDDHEVRVTLEFTNGTTTSLSDPDGCGDGSGAEAYARVIKRYRLCGSGIACTPWKIA